MSRHENNASTPPDSPDSTPEIACDEARIYLHLAVEDELDTLRWTQLGPHLETCADCAQRNQELRDEKRWLLAGMLRAPQLPDHFASSLCAQLEAEGATPFDLADPLAETANAELASREKIGVVRPRRSARRWTLREALPWLSAAAVAVFFAALAGVFELQPDPASNRVRVVGLPQGSPDNDAEITPTGASNARIDTPRVTADLPGVPVNPELASSRVIRSPQSCSLERPHPVVMSCPQIDVFVEAVEATTSPKVIPRITDFDVPRTRPGPQNVTPRITVLVHGTAVQNGAAGSVRSEARSIVPGAHEGSRHFGRVFGLMARLSVHRRTSLAPQPEDKDPCAEDPNADGELDIVDVTHLCREIMQPDAVVAASSLALAATPTVNEIDCDEEKDCI